MSSKRRILLLAISTTVLALAEHVQSAGQTAQATSQIVLSFTPQVQWRYERSRESARFCLRNIPAKHFRLTSEALLSSSEQRVYYSGADKCLETKSIENFSGVMISAE
ncbi:hypothetical protein [Microbulbifer sp. PSTR4-B]|uniref:hypothetical protein n=1 Tax=unclassified Microbulbifer TaxID=2619833 RepID=UPI00403A7281